MAWSSTPLDWTQTLLDTLTLRVAFGVVALTLLVLFYAVTYRATRSVYCGWWCLSLALFLGGSSLYLLDHTAQQRWANPLGNGLIVLGSACVWAGACSLRGRSPSAWQLLLGPVVVVVVSAFDHPATNVWSGGIVFLAAMSAVVGLASRQLWMLQRQAGTEVWLTVVRAMATMSSIFSLFYLGRWVAFLAVGPDAAPFTTVFGSQTTTLVTMVLLATVSVSMSSLSHEQQTGDLRARADRDPLTGLLNRSAFLRLARVEERKVQGGAAPATVVVADLDHFKKVNDTLGHAAGDEVVQRFAATCLDAVRATDLVARLGGDEFVLVLPGVPARRAHEVTLDISARFATLAEAGRPHLPTVSFGIATLDVGGSVEAALASADVALYAAKDAGRDRAVVQPATDGGHLAPREESRTT